MIGYDDGWKIYVGIMPFCCGEGKEWHDGLHHIKEGLPALPSRGDIFRPTEEAYRDMIAFHGERPCEQCEDKDGGCCCHGYGPSPIYHTSDCNYVRAVWFLQEEKEIIILLSCKTSFRPSELDEIKSNKLYGKMLELYSQL